MADARRRPCLGYRSQAQACAALADAGHSPEEIAGKIGRDANHVRATLRRVRVPAKARTFTLPLSLLRGLEGPAAERGITSSELAARLIEAIVVDDLFEALLGELEDGHA